MKRDNNIKGYTVVLMPIVAGSVIFGLGKTLGIPTDVDIFFSWLLLVVFMLIVAGSVTFGLGKTLGIPIDIDNVFSWLLLPIFFGILCLLNLIIFWK